jgi:3-hydroxyisobutyrate dehydrogenase-like beta-hydroxyacid dehydrogenase
MARCIAQAGFPTTVYDVRAEVVGEAEGHGARGATSAAEVARASDVVCIVVLDLAQVEEVLFGADGVMTGARDGLVVCVCSTIDDAALLDLADRAAAQGVDLIDSGVAGGPINAVIASLVTMVGGPDEAVARARPVLDAFSAEVIHAGPTGAGMRLKLVKNLASYLVMCVANETMLFADAIGIPADLVNRVNESSNMLDQFWRMTVERPTNQRLTLDAPAAEIAEARALTDLCQKDLDAILALANRSGIALPVARNARACAPRYFLAPRPPSSPRRSTSA